MLCYAGSGLAGNDQLNDRQGTCLMNFILVAICLLAGFLLRSSHALPKDAHKGINAWIMYIAFPAVALHYVPSIPWSLHLLLPFAMPFIVWFGAWITLKIATPLLKLNPSAFGALLLTSGLGNTSFIGFPLTQAYWGAEGLRIAVICDQLSFIVFSTIGLVSAMHIAHSQNNNLRNVLIGLIKFPPFLSFGAALLLPHFVSFAAFDPLLKTLAGTLVPLALFSVGMQIQFSEWKRQIKFLMLGLSYKLFIAPLIILGIASLTGVRGIAAQASIFEAAMAPGITASIIAGEYGLDPKLSSLMASVGLVLSFITTFMWWLLLK
jgi:predicted permease